MVKRFTCLAGELPDDLTLIILPSARIDPNANSSPGYAFVFLFVYKKSLLPLAKRLLPEL
jgi:hypothetical protein